MGYMRHHAVLVSSGDDKYIESASSKAASLGLQILGPSEALCNGFRSFLICPDGSKEGWYESSKGDACRKEFRDWLNSQKYADGSTNLHWVEVSYSPDDMIASIEHHAWSDKTLDNTE